MRPSQCFAWSSGKRRELFDKLHSARRPFLVLQTTRSDHGDHLCVIVLVSAPKLFAVLPTFCQENIVHVAAQFWRGMSDAELTAACLDRGPFRDMQNGSSGPYIHDSSAFTNDPLNAIMLSSEPLNSHVYSACLGWPVPNEFWLRDLRNRNHWHCLCLSTNPSSVSCSFQLRSCCVSSSLRQPAAVVFCFWNKSELNWCLSSTRLVWKNLSADPEAVHLELILCQSFILFSFPFVLMKKTWSKVSTVWEFDMNPQDTLWANRCFRGAWHFTSSTCHRALYLACSSIFLPQQSVECYTVYRVLSNVRFCERSLTFFLKRAFWLVSAAATIKHQCLRKWKSEQNLRLWSPIGRFVPKLCKQDSVYKCSIH